MSALSNFTSEVKKRGLAKASHYTVYFSVPSFMSSSNEDTQMIHLFCEATQFPEFVLATAPIKEDGNTREIVYDKIYPPIMCTFICDSQMRVKRFFDKWVQGAVFDIGGVFRYSNTYTIPELIIYQLNAKKEVTYKVTLKDVYPKMVSDIGLSASSRDYNRVQVQFVYRNWTSESVRDNVSPKLGASVGNESSNVKVKDTSPPMMSKIGGIPAHLGDF